MSASKVGKETDYPFEKIFLVFLAIALCIAFFFLLDKIISSVPDIKKLFAAHAVGFRGFAITAIALLIFACCRYLRTLDFWEAETNATIKVSVTNAVRWSVFWICWSIYCAWLTRQFHPMPATVAWTIAGLATIPGLVAFFISRHTRRQQLEQEEEDKAVINDNGATVEPYTISFDRKYFSGYYGLLCLPVYILLLLIPV